MHVSGLANFYAFHSFFLLWIGKTCAPVISSCHSRSSFPLCAFFNHVLKKEHVSVLPLLRLHSLYVVHSAYILAVFDVHVQKVMVERRKLLYLVANTLVVIFQLCRTSISMFCCDCTVRYSPKCFCNCAEFRWATRVVLLLNSFNILTDVIKQFCLLKSILP